MQYHGCELVMMLPVPTKTGELNIVSGYILMKKYSKEFNTHGITPKIFEVASQLHNFKHSFQPAYIDVAYMPSFHPDFYILEPQNSNRTVHVYFEATSINYKYDHHRISKAFHDINFFILVTPGELYSPYEKLLLPFDKTTWILLLSTFAHAFLTIFIINRFSIRVQNILYGRRITTPTVNVIQIFFGISQTRLPREHFSRFILMLFIGFCLIIRTCFQSKFFEFMTSEPRRPPPKTLEELIERNYTVYAYSQYALMETIREQYGRR